MKKMFGLLCAVLGLGGVVSFGFMKAQPVLPVYAEGEVVEDEDKATVILPKVEHGEVEATILEGKAGDVCELNIRPEMFYIISNVSVNGTALVEDENISGLFKFTLVKGDNKVEINIVVNKELLGELSTIYEQAKNKDWTNLFTVENVIHLIRWVLDCGILVAIVRYFIRDKRLADKVCKDVKSEVDKIIPDTTKQAVVATVQGVLEPIFAQMKADNIEMMRAMGVFAKCMALAQEDTPESRIAILNMLSELNISDEKTLAEVKAYIDKLFADHIDSYNKIMESLDQISKENKEIAGGSESEPNPEEESEEDLPDGTSI